MLVLLHYKSMFNNLKFLFLWKKIWYIYSNKVHFKKPILEYLLYLLYKAMQIMENCFPLGFVGQTFSYALYQLVG